ncbi:MAG: Hsp20/alpha crystallin family protein [Reyranellaceae bacterium]
MTNDSRDWMWSEALQMLARAEQVHRQVFAAPHAAGRRVNWEPPVDVLETEDAVLLYVALPGVDPAKVELGIKGGRLVIAGERALPAEARTAVIHRLELPQGRFERQLPLPPGRYENPRSTVVNGCLVIRLSKAAVAGRGQP